MKPDATDGRRSHEAVLRGMIALRIPQNLIETNVRRGQIPADELQEFETADLIFSTLADIEITL